MKGILDALHEGRLIELPDNRKDRAIEYLANLIEAVPDIGVEGGITEKVLAREQAHNTGIGNGWACPHARTNSHGDLVCAVGWSPAGVDYGAPDGKPVHLMVMYFVPEAQKNAYLKDISSLAKAIKTHPALQDIQSLSDLAAVRDGLLDAITAAFESSAPEAKARMIQLEVRHAAAEAAGTAGPVPADLARNVVAVTILTMPGAKALALGQDRDMVHAIESAPAELVAQLAEKGRAEHQGVHLLLRSSANYQPDRVVYECLAFRA